MGWFNKPFPLLHHLPALFQCIAAPVGGFHFDYQGAREGLLSQLPGVNSTDRRNRLIEHFSRGSISQSFAWSLIELSGNSVQAVL